MILWPAAGLPAVLRFTTSARKYSNNFLMMPRGRILRLSRWRQNIKDPTSSRTGDTQHCKLQAARGRLRLLPKAACSLQPLLAVCLVALPCDLQPNLDPASSRQMMPTTCNLSSLLHPCARKARDCRMLKSEKYKNNKTP